MIDSQPSSTNNAIAYSSIGIQQIFRSWVDAPSNDSWSKINSENKVSRKVYKPSITFSGYIVGDQRDSFEYGLKNRQIEGESTRDYIKRLSAQAQETVRRYKLGVPIDDNNSNVHFVGIFSNLGTLKSRRIMLYIDSTPKDDTTRVGSVIFHYGDSSTVLQELDNLLSLARRWRADGNNHDEREKSFTYGSEFSDHFTVTISQRSGSDNLMWQVFGKNSTEFTSQYTKAAKDAPNNRGRLDSKGKIIVNKDGSIKLTTNDGFSEFSLFVNQLRTIVRELDVIK